MVTFHILSLNQGMISGRYQKLIIITKDIDTMIEYLIFILIGIILGGFGTLLFFRFDSQWKQVLGGVGDFSGSTGIFVILAEYFEISKERRAGCYLALLFALIGSVVVAFFLLAKLIQKDDAKFPIRKLDIILGYDKYLDQYYDSRIAEVDKEQIAQAKGKIESQQREINEAREKLDEQMKNAVQISLPQNAKIPITNQFMEMLPVYVEHICVFKRNVTDLTNQIIQKLSEDKNENADLLKGYFAGIGMYVSNDLFGIAQNTKEIRTHFRILKNGKYTKYTVVEGSKLSDAKLHDIPANEDSLITKSYELRRSILASLNSEDIYDVNTKWADFMTISYYNIGSEDKPFLSMGISVKNVRQFDDLMIFLNYCKIEDCLQNCIERINEKCNIVDTLR